VTRLLDVNLLMALLWENHEHHTRARSWFKGVSGFATCPVVQLGFARVSSHPLLGYGLTPELAFGVLRQLKPVPRRSIPAPPGELLHRPALPFQSAILGPIPPGSPH
jgi:predicted nucleic acid-binding protein